MYPKYKTVKYLQYWYDDKGGSGLPTYPQMVCNWFILGLAFFQASSSEDQPSEQHHSLSCSLFGSRSVCYPLGWDFELRLVDALG